MNRQSINPLSAAQYLNFAVSTVTDTDTISLEQVKLHVETELKGCRITQDDLFKNDFDRLSKLGITPKRRDE